MHPGYVLRRQVSIVMRRAAGILSVNEGLAMLDPLGKGSGYFHRNGIPHERPKASRLLAGAAAVLLVCTAISCSSSGSGTPTASGVFSPSTSGLGAPTRTPGAISIPTGDLDPFARCMVGIGWEITAVNTPFASGFPTSYQWKYTGDLNSQEVLVQTQQCKALRPVAPTLTTNELRALYDHWVEVYHCLVGLGYQPDPPSSFETFLATYFDKKTGPWMPIDGVDVDHWTQAQYDQAKSKCNLDMWSDDRYDR